ncbi:MAG: hypothetical protein R2807_08385 [Chitinophagales bacterium]
MLFINAINIDDISQLYSVGNVIPILKIHHVQLAVLISCTILMLISITLDDIEKWKKIVAILIAFCLLLFIHFFAVRTGILLTYLFIISYLTNTIIQQKKWKMLSIFLIYNIESIRFYGMFQQF